MLVLTRKTDEQILIGDNIRITLVRVRGNSVRIGIDAPRDVRVIRGELQALESNADDAMEFELDDREQVFAHPQAKMIGRSSKSSARPVAEVEVEVETRDSVDRAVEPQIFIGRVRCASDESKPPRAPLADFVSAT